MFDAPKAAHAMFIVTTGLPSTYTVHLEGTPDGVNWFEVGSVINSPMLNFGNWPMLGIRANLISLSDGTLPTLSAWIASA